MVDWDEVLGFLMEPHTYSEVSQRFETETAGSRLSLLFKEGRLVRSTPVMLEFKTSRKRRSAGRGHYGRPTWKRKSYFYLNGEKGRGVHFVPQVQRNVRFYDYETWTRKFDFGKHSLKSGEVLAYVEKVKAVTAAELADHFGAKRRRASAMLHRLAKDGKVLRKGRMNPFGKEVILAGVGYVYGVDYDMMWKKVKQLQESEEVFPALRRVMDRVDADSGQGELTPEKIFRDTPFNIWTDTLGKIMSYLEQDERYTVQAFGVDKWLYNKNLIGAVLTEEEIAEKLKKVKDGLERIFNVRVLSGIALEVVVLKALRLWGEFDHIETNVYVPKYNPYGREFDFVALSRFRHLDERVLPRVYVGEVKLEMVGAPAITRFYEKLRHAKFVKVKGKMVGLAEKAEMRLSKEAAISAWTMKGYVTPIFIGAGFTKDATRKCYEYGVIWMYANDLCTILEKKVRRRINPNRLMKIMEKYRREEGPSSSSWKDVRRRVQKFLEKELGI